MNLGCPKERGIKENNKKPFNTLRPSQSPILAPFCALKLCATSQKSCLAIQKMPDESKKRQTMQNKKPKNCIADLSSSVQLIVRHFIEILKNLEKSCMKIYRVFLFTGPPPKFFKYKIPCKLARNFSLCQQL